MLAFKDVTERANFQHPHLHVQAVLIGLGVHSNGLQTELLARTDHTHSNLTTVGNQHPGEALARLAGGNSLVARGACDLEGEYDIASVATVKYVDQKPDARYEPSEGHDPFVYLDIHEQITYAPDLNEIVSPMNLTKKPKNWPPTLRHFPTPWFWPMTKCHTPLHETIKR